jgi:hypothetical protein
VFATQQGTSRGNYAEARQENKMKYTVHGSFVNPNKAKEYARFSSKDFATEEEASLEVDKWTRIAKYPFIWVEETGK